LASNKDYKKEWFNKAKVDYFSPFVNLWLACNSWYNFHYAELKNDREQVNNLKSDTTKQNVLYRRFRTVFSGASDKEQASLYTNLELLHFSLTRAEIKPHKLINILSIMSAPIDYSKKDKTEGYEDLIIKNAKTVTGKIKKNINGIELGDIVIVNDPQKVFSGLLEIIYQVRCMLVHGELEPETYY
jgi:hypothetical protein